MRMPPGPDGVWAAGRIREMDPAIEIVLCTAYSDVVPADIGGIVPPEEKLSYLQKPFHPHEIRQMTISLASKWRSEHRIVKLAYFDALTGLPNREQSRNGNRNHRVCRHEGRSVGGIGAAAVEGFGGAARHR
jgi:diguanylate cyclase